MVIFSSIPQDMGLKSESMLGHSGSTVRTKTISTQWDLLSAVFYYLHQPAMTFASILQWRPEVWGCGEVERWGWEKTRPDTYQVMYKDQLRKERMLWDVATPNVFVYNRKPIASLYSLHTSPFFLRLWAVPYGRLEKKKLNTEYLPEICVAYYITSICPRKCVCLEYLSCDVLLLSGCLVCGSCEYTSKVRHRSLCVGIGWWRQATHSFFTREL